MPHTPSTPESRAYKLASNDVLSFKEVGKLTGLDEVEAKSLLRRAGYQASCTPSGLVDLCAGLKCSAKLVLHPEFVRGVLVKRKAEKALAAWLEGLCSMLRKKGLANLSISYADFLRLTTFGANHLGNLGGYALHQQQGQVVAIQAGPGFFADHPLYIDAEMQVIADFQRDAALPLPTTAEGLVIWVSKQAGEVELAIPGSDEYPVDPVQWVSALVIQREEIQQVDNGSDPESIWKPYVPSQKARAIQILVIEALNSMRSDVNTISPHEIRTWLLENRPKEVVMTKDGAEYHDGSKWVPLTIEAIAGQLAKVKAACADNSLKG